MTPFLLCAALLQGANKDLPSVAYIQWSPALPWTKRKILILERIGYPALLQPSWSKNIYNVV